jgi:N-sulfoglucosamine sulfohydrolase
LNILYFHVHDMGRWVQPYGYPVPAPNYAELAEESVLFRKAFSTAPTCSPSRAGLLTGLSPHRAGMLGLAHRGFSLVECEKHLAHWLARHGYQTAISGIQHEVPGGNEADLGYARVVTPPRRGPDPRQADADWTEAACRFLAEKHEKPFFLSLGLFFPHRDFPPVSDTINPDRLTPPFPVPDTKISREDFAAYCTAAAAADACLGRVRETLRANGLDRNTLVLVTTDHGPAMPRMKCNLSDTGTGVVLMFAYPGNPMRGRISDALVSHLDVYPTLCDLAGIPKPDWLEGWSLQPLIEGRVASVRDEVQSGVTYHAAYQPMRAVRTESHKLIRRFYPPTFHPMPVNVDEGLTKSFLMSHGWGAQVYPEWELYDLNLDPYETKNLAFDPGSQAIFKAMQTRLEKWMKATDDPLIDGDFVPPPEGSRVNLISCLHPEEAKWEATTPRPQ